MNWSIILNIFLIYYYESPILHSGLRITNVRITVFTNRPNWGKLKSDILETVIPMCMVSVKRILCYLVNFLKKNRNTIWKALIAAWLMRFIIKKKNPYLVPISPFTVMRTARILKIYFSIPGKIHLLKILLTFHDALKRTSFRKTPKSILSSCWDLSSISPHISHKITDWKRIIIVLNNTTQASEKKLFLLTLKGDSTV